MPNLSASFFVSFMHIYHNEFFLYPWKCIGGYLQKADSMSGIGAVLGIEMILESVVNG